MSCLSWKHISKSKFSWSYEINTTVICYPYVFGCVHNFLTAVEEEPEKLTEPTEELVHPSPSENLTSSEDPVNRLSNENNSLLPVNLDLWN